MSRLAFSALFTFLAVTAHAREPVTLRLMTYNIRLDLASDGMNSWPHRRNWVVAQVQWLHPDLFGMQEVVPGQKADLVAALPGYKLIGGGRDDGEKGEAVPIGFDPKRFDLLDSGLYWLSPTPAVPSKGWDAAFNRIVTWLRLRVHGTGQQVLAVNTHWDHIGTVARLESARQMARWIAANRKPCERVIVFGDFNTGLDTEPLQLFTTSAKLHDARDLSKTPPFGPAATFNDFKNPPTDTRTIDHFLIDDGIEVERYMVLSQIIDGRWPSDHFPLLVEVSIAECR
jgi:endonuclease/exonuclease/phosphatase family metal-dependent hydrolase